MNNIDEMVHDDLKKRKPVKSPMLDINNEFINSTGPQIYINEILEGLKLSFPGMYPSELIEAIKYSIKKRGTNWGDILLDNNYKKTAQTTTLIDITNYILEREPIITMSGVLFSKHGTTRNPFAKLVGEFIDQRQYYKDLMFKYYKDPALFEKYNLRQLSEKKSGNSIYGASGLCTSVFYNVYVSRSVTMLGRVSISSAVLLAEALMANNVKFGSLNDIVQFIINIKRETRKFDDSEIIDIDVTINDVFAQLITTCGFYYIPTEHDMQIIWDMLQQLSHQDLVRIFYKNNLYWFIDNKYVENLLVKILSKLDSPFLDPNEPPEIIQEDLDHFYDLLKEYVYYDKQYMDRMDRNMNMTKAVSILTDTDSSFVSFDAWFRYMLKKVNHIPMKIKELEYNPDKDTLYKSDARKYDYNFYTDEVFEREQFIKPRVVGPTVMFSTAIVNLLAYIIGKISTDYMYKYGTNSNVHDSVDGSEVPGILLLKNEFQIKRMLLTSGKMNYCTIKERQESKLIDEKKSLDIKGMPINKIGIPDRTKKRLKDILFELVLNAGDDIDQVEIVKQLVIIEKQIIESIKSGDTTYFKIARVKSKRSYEKPMSILGIKGFIAYNTIINPEDEKVDLDDSNTAYIVKVKIDASEAEKIRTTYPNQYNGIMKLLKIKEYSPMITKICIPVGTPLPEWIKHFINYSEIVNDNLKTFPIESIGLDRKDNDRVNYTNIVKL